jgi:hypothetical protein
MTGEPTPPPLTVWRDKLPYPCTMTYWGRRWTCNRQWPFLHRCHAWTAHAPIHGPEQVQYRGGNVGGKHLVTWVAADGSYLPLAGNRRSAEHPDDLT